MNAKLGELVAAFNLLEKQLDNVWASDKPLYIVTGNPIFGGSDKEDIRREIDHAVTSAKTLTDKECEGETDWLVEYTNRINYARENILPQLTSSPHALSALTMTITSAKKYLSNLANYGENPLVSLRKAAVRVRAVEASLRVLEPRTRDLTQLVNRIEAAHEAAEQLPTDLEQLAEANRAVADLRTASDVDRNAIRDALNRVAALKAQVETRRDEAEALMSRLDSAYAAATSQGLAASFQSKAIALDTTIKWWVGGLGLALLAGAVAGAGRITAILDAVRSGNARTDVLTLHMILAAVSVGPAVWFAWLATKQIGQRFRLAEDYSFKAAVACAYEGFRREAVRVDAGLEAELLRSALARLDEQPLRFVEPPSHGSPLHEAMSAEVVKEAFKAVPDFGKRVREFASDTLSRVRPSSRAEPLGPVPRSNSTGVSD